MVKSKGDGQLHEQMLEAFENAKELGLGIHSKDPKIISENTRDPKWSNIQLSKLVKSTKSPVKAIVENVLSGSTIVVQLLPTFENVVLQLTGIRCPIIRYKTVEEIGPNGNVVTVKKADPEPMAQEAKHFTEMRLLNRDVLIYLEGSREDKKEKVLIGSLIPIITTSTSTQNDNKTTERPHQVELLERGFARYIDFENFDSIFTDQFIDAEKIAKQKRLRIWKDYEAPESSLQEGDKSISQARVLEIVSGDKIRVRYEDGNEELLSLSCVKAPNIGGKNAQPEPWSIEAKDLLRSTIAGHPVTIQIDYRKSIKSNKDTQESNEATEDRKFATVRVNGKNVAIPLIKSGFVNFIKRNTDEDKPEDYKELVKASQNAVKDKKGLYGNQKNTSKTLINDLTFKNLGEIQKISHLLIGKKFKAVVEKVHAVHRFKLYLPQDHFKIIFNISGVNSPSLKTATEEEKKYIEEGVNFAINNILLKDVEVEIQSMNNVGNFLGTIKINGKDTYVYNIIKEGFVEVRGFVDKLSNSDQLKKAEEEAKSNPKRLYINWKQRQSNEDENEENESENSNKQDSQKDVSFIVHNERSTLHPIRVTEIIDSSHLYMQTSDAKINLQKIDSLLEKLNLDEKPSFNPPKSGDLCFAKYTYDGQWYRAKVTNVQPKNSTVTVDYIDFGNSEVLSFTSIRAVEKNSISTELLSIPPQVKEVYFAFTSPVNEKFADDAYNYLSEKILDVEIFARLEYEEKSSTHKQYVSLFLNQDSKSIQELLLDQGYASVNVPQYFQKREYSEWLRSRTGALHRAEDNAKTFRRGQWENSY